MEFTFCTGHPVDLLSVIILVHGILSVFLMRLFSNEKPGCISLLVFFSVNDLQPCVATGRINAVISRSLMAVLTDMFFHIFVNLTITANVFLEDSRSVGRLSATSVMLTTLSYWPLLQRYYRNCKLSSSSPVLLGC